MSRYFQIPISVELGYWKERSEFTLRVKEDNFERSYLFESFNVRYETIFDMALHTILLKRSAKDIEWFFRELRRKKTEQIRKAYEEDWDQKREMTLMNQRVTESMKPFVKEEV